MKKKFEEVMLCIAVALLVLSASYMMFSIGMTHQLQRSEVLKQANSIVAQYNQMKEEAVRKQQIEQAK